MSDFRKSKLEDRYFNDPAFSQLVKAIENMITQHGFTPSEIREACFLAHYKYEMESPLAQDRKVQQIIDFALNRGLK